MFKKTPKILAHKSSLNKGNFVTPQYILNKGTDTVNLFRRYCPHRMYPMETPGTNVNEITCHFHNFKWNAIGEPLNNNKKLGCGSAQVGRSGLVLKDFVEPNHQWVEDLANETNLEYSHSLQGSSTGSWLWMMEIQADLFHIRQGEGAIHPVLSEQTNLDNIVMDHGDGWILQTCSTGWWLFVYPFTFVEWSPGCVSVNYTIPKDLHNEFGFDWITQFYYNNTVSESKRKEFETLEDVFHEDVQAIEKQKGPYFPLMAAINRLEEHCVHWGAWVQDNLENNKPVNSSSV
jgi:hypothetical protein